MKKRLFGLLLLFGTLFSQCVDGQTLVSWWQFENNLLDSVGTNNGAIIQQVSYVPGESGQAWDITGGILEVPDSPSLDAVTSITLQAWVKSSAPGTFKYIISKAYGSGGVSYAFYTGSGGGAAFFVNLNVAGVVLSPVVAPASVWDGNWHQLTGVYDGSHVYLFLDGQEVGTPTAAPASSGIVYPGPKQIIFGDYQVARGLPYAGSLDEVKMYNTALSASDVSNSFQNPADATTNGLVSWWRAEGNVNDSWGTNNGFAVAATAAYASGENGTALIGQGGRAVVPESPSLEPATVTVQAWVNSAFPLPFRYLVSKAYGSGGVSYALYTGPDCGAKFFVTDSSAGTVLTPSAQTGQVWDGAWHQLTGTFDGTNVALYVDGFQVGATVVTGSSGIKYTTPGPLVLCDFSAAGGLAYSGLLDDVKIFNGAMTPAQVLASYSSNLVSWWQASTNAADSIGTNNGVLAGAATFGLGRVNGRAFETSGGSVQIPDSPSLQISSNLTLEAQVVATSPGASKYLIAKSDTPTAGSYGFTTGPSGGLQFFVTTSGTQITSPDAGTNLWDGDFHVIDGTYDGTKVHLYVDGVEAGSGTAASGTIQYGETQNSGALIFGDFATSPSSANFPGAIAQIKLYNIALNAQSATLGVPHNAVVLEQPQSQSVPAGRDATFIANIQSSVFSGYQWQFNGTNIPGATNLTLTVQAGPATAGSYTIIETNGIVDYVPGESGLAFDLSQGGILEASDAMGLYDLQTVTYQAWVRGTNVGPFKYIFSKSRNDTTASCGLYTGASGGLEFFVELTELNPPTDDVLFSCQTTSTNMWDGNWHQVTGTWDGEFISLYLDGQLVTNADSGTANLIDYQTFFQGGNLLIGDFAEPPGALMNSGVLHYPGQIDEVKVFNIALSAGAVADTFTNATSIDATNGLVSWWKGEGNVVDSWSTNSTLALLPPGTVTSDAAILTIAIPPPTLSGSIFNPTLRTFQASVSGPTGTSCVVQRAYSLPGGPWTPIYTNVAPFTFTDTESTNRAAFYRAVTQ